MTNVCDWYFHNEDMACPESYYPHPPLLNKQFKLIAYQEALHMCSPDQILPMEALSW